MTTAIEIEQGVRSYLREVFFVEELSPDESFLESGLIDSTGMIELVAFVQQSFGVEIDDSELLPENLDSLSRLTAFVARKHAQTSRE
jgi:acyl carrier protein